jgi:hypothetical protein
VTWLIAWIVAPHPGIYGDGAAIPQQCEAAQLLGEGVKSVAKKKDKKGKK